MKVVVRVAVVRREEFRPGHRYKVEVQLAGVLPWETERQTRLVQNNTEDDENGCRFRTAKLDDRGAMSEVRVNRDLLSL